MKEWTRMSRWQKIIKELLRYGNKVQLLVHEKPDGDCLGSVLALGLALKNEGLDPVLNLPEPFPIRYQFLPGQEELNIRTEECLIPNTPIITVDCADSERTGYEIPSQGILVNIDHHISNKHHGLINIVDVQASATGEILYMLFEEEKVRITPEIATCLYVSLIADTGSFTYSNTRSQTLRIASELVELGADLETIRLHVYEKRPFAEVLLLKKAFEHLEFKHQQMIAVSYLAYEDIQQFNLFSSDTDSLLGLLRSTEGVEVVLLFKEFLPEKTKVSIRTKSFLDANYLAQEFNGGGHARAAGCQVNGPLEEVIPKVLNKTVEYLESRGENGRRN